LDFIESCRKLISLDASPEQGNYLVAQFLAEYASDNGFLVEKLEEVSGDKKQMNLIITPTNQKTEFDFMLQTHLDTPDPGPFGLWNKTGSNPFDAHIIDGNIYGLGAADTKLDFLCKLEALNRIDKNSNWKVLPKIVATYGEETGMNGALKLIRKNKIKAKYALIGEPSDLHIITSGKGLASVEIHIPFGEDEKKYRIEHNLKESTSTVSKIFNGKSAHSSTPQMGESAIKKLFEYLLKMPSDITIMEIDGGVNFNTVPANSILEIDFVPGHRISMAKKLTTIYKAICDLEDKFLQFQDEEFQPSSPTLNIGLVRTKEDSIFISGTCRIPPSVSNEIYEGWMKELALVCQSVEAEFRITDYKRPFKGDKGSEFVQICQSQLKKMNLPEKIITIPSTNEASIFARTGIECICFGAGKREGNIHTPSEHVSIESLQKATDFYEKIIQKVCL